MGMPDPNEMRTRMLDDMAHNLGLTDAQKQQLKTAMEEGLDPRSIFSDNSLSREQKFQRMGKMREEREARIRAILTPEQQEPTNRRKRRCVSGFRGMGRPGRGSGGPGGFGRGQALQRPPMAIAKEPVRHPTRMQPG